MSKRHHRVNCVSRANDRGQELPHHGVKSSLGSKQLLQPAESMSWSREIADAHLLTLCPALHT